MIRPADATARAASPGRRRAVLTALYFAEGAPIGFIYWYLGTHLAARGVPDVRLGSLTALAVLPWTLKFLWAPAVDALGGGRTGYRPIVLGAQAAMVLALAPLLAFDWVGSLDLLTVCVVVHSICAATQDVAIDAWMIRVTPPAELGRTTAWMQAGYRGAMWFFGYGLLALADAPPPRVVVLTLCAAIAATGAASLLLPEPPRASAAARASVGPALARLATRRATWVTVGFALTAGAGFEAAGSGLGRLFLARGLDEGTVGTIASASILGLVPGGFLGGRLADRAGQPFALVLSGLVIAVTVTALGALAAPTHGELITLGFTLYAAIGAFTSASYAWFATRAAGPACATAFSLFMAATNGCESWSAAALGVLVPRHGWTVALGVMAGVGALGLLWLAADRNAPSRADP